jgi:hypothetical protein
MNLPFISTVFWDKFGGNSSPLTPGLPNCKKIGKICISQQTSEVDLGQIHNRGVILAANAQSPSESKMPKTIPHKKKLLLGGKATPKNHHLLQ